MKKWASQLLLASILISPIAAVKVETPKVHAATNLIVDQNLTNQVTNLTSIDSM